MSKSEKSGGRKHMNAKLQLSWEQARILKALLGSDLASTEDSSVALVCRRVLSQLEEQGL